MRAKLMSIGSFPLVRIEYEGFGYVEYLRPKPDLVRFVGMETKVKGSEQPPTQVGLEDDRTKTGEKKGDRTDVGGITDEVMKHQSKDHQVQRT